LDFAQSLDRDEFTAATTTELQNGRVFSLSYFLAQGPLAEYRTPDIKLSRFLILGAPVDSLYLSDVTRNGTNGDKVVRVRSEPHTFDAIVQPDEETDTDARQYTPG
jgi:hypothetical protein